MKVFTESSILVAIDAVRSKSTTVEKIKSQYKLTDEQLKQLQDAESEA